MNSNPEMQCDIIIQNKDDIITQNKDEDKRYNIRNRMDSYNVRMFYPIHLATPEPFSKYA